MLILTGIVILAIFISSFTILYFTRKDMDEFLQRRSGRELQQSVANITGSAKAISDGVSDRTAGRILQYYVKLYENRDYSQNHYVLCSGDTVLHNDSGINAPSIINQHSAELVGPDEVAFGYCIFNADHQTYAIAERDFSFHNTWYAFYLVSDITEYVSQQRLLTAASILSGLLLSLLTGWLILSYLKRELSALEDVEKAAASIASGNYSQRLPIDREDEMGALARSFNQMARQVENYIRSVQDTAESRKLLLHALAHEMRTPITAITGFSYALTHMNLPEERKNEAISFIDQEARRLERMSTKLTQLVGLDGKEAEQLRESMRQIPADEFERVLRSALADHPEVALSMEKEPLYGDPDLLTMLVVNLCNNSQKAGSTRTTVIWQDGTRSVADNGCGIPKDQIEHIQEPFYRGDRSRNTEGFGIGLTLCSQIVRLHEAKMQIESKEGEGSKFRITFTNP